MNSCVVQSTDSLNFGVYIPSSSAALQTSGQIKLKYTKGVTASAQPVAGGTSLMGPSGNLNYGLFSDSGLTHPWGGSNSGIVVLDFGSASTGLYFLNMVTNTTLAQCQALAGNHIFVMSSSNNSCYYNYSSQSISGKTFGFGDMPHFGLSWATGSQIRQPCTTSFPTAYLPTTSTLINDYNYNVSVLPASLNTPLIDTSSGAGNVMVLTYYGQIPTRQDIQTGIYTDSVIVQVSF